MTKADGTKVSGTGELGFLLDPPAGAVAAPAKDQPVTIKKDGTK